jgi:predicted transcriptional regulator
MGVNDDRLEVLMNKHGLSYADVAGMLHVTSAAVTSWLRPDDNKAKRQMPLAMLELLEYKLGERK